MRRSQPPPPNGTSKTKFLCKTPALTTQRKPSPLNLYREQHSDYEALESEVVEILKGFLDV